MPSQEDFRKSGEEKAFFGKAMIHIGILQKGDQKTVYNMLYVDGTTQKAYAKRFQVGGITRDKVYPLTQGTLGSRLLYLSVNPNGEGDTVRVELADGQGARKTELEFDFDSIAVKNRNALGNIVTKYRVKKVKALNRAK